MKRPLLIITLFCLTALSLKANPIDATKAQTAASKFFEAMTELSFHKGSIAEMVYADYITSTLREKMTDLGFDFLPDLFG